MTSRMLLAVGLLAAAAPASAGDGFTLGLAELPLATAAATPADAADAFSLRLQSPASELSLSFSAALDAPTATDFRLALWTSPMGRLAYLRAEQEALLGREGLVHGGRTIGLGLSTSALGDGSPSGLGRLAGGGRWSELTLGGKVSAGVEASFLAALVYAMFELAD